MPHSKPRSPHLPVRPRMVVRRWMLALLLAAAGVLAGLPAAAEPLKARRPGEEVVIGQCLRVAVLGFTDRNGPLDPVDWVTLKVTNGCNEPVRHLLVDLLLQDVFGKAYGVRTWILAQGEVLRPGHSKTARYAVPDHADHLPRRWAVRLRQVEKPSDRRAAKKAPRVSAAPDATSAEADADTDPDAGDPSIAAAPRRTPDRQAPSATRGPAPLRRRPAG